MSTNVVEFEQQLAESVRRAFEIGGPRDPLAMYRRVWKLSEEAGEVAGAYLSVSQPSSNYKRITADDVREEAVDVFTVALDVWLFTVGANPPENYLRRATDLILENRKYAKSCGPRAFEDLLFQLSKGLGRLSAVCRFNSLAEFNRNEWLHPADELLRTTSALMFTRSSVEATLTDDTVLQHLVTKLDKWERVIRPVQPA